MSIIKRVAPGFVGQLLVLAIFVWIAASALI